MAKKKKNDVVSIEELMLRNDDTDPTGGKKKRNKWRLYKPYSEMTLWDKVKGCAFWLIGVFILLVAIIPPKDKVTTTPKTSNPDLAFVGNIPTSTPRTSNPTQVNERETSIAQSVSTMRVIQTQGAITALPTTLTNVVVFATNTALPVTDSPTNTDMPTNTPSPTPLPTQAGVREIADEGVVTGESVRVRSCASTDCNQVGLMNRGVTFPITGSVADGQSIEGNRLWYQIEYEGQVGYVSATLVGLVSAQPVSAPVNQSIAPVSTVAPISVAPSTQWNCSGDVYNCSDFGSGGQFTCGQLIEYMNTCTGDPSRLDQGGEAGVACESRCG